MRKHKRLLVGVVTLVMLLAAATTAAAEQVVTFWTWGATHINAIIESLARDFEAENPGIRIEVIPQTPPTRTWESWAVAVAGGVPPDASMAHWGIFESMAEALEPLEDYAARSENMKREHYFDVHWDLNWYGDHMLALPFRVNSQVIMYDKHTFAEVGLDPERPPQTWPELEAYARRLTRREEDRTTRFGFSFRDATYSRTVNHFAERNGWQPFSRSFTEAYYGDNKLVQAVEFLNGMVSEGIATLRGLPYTGQLGAGRVGMLNDGPWALNTQLVANPEMEIGAFLPPLGPSGAPPYANIGGENLVIFKDSPNKEAAWKWISYLA